MCQPLKTPRAGTKTQNLTARRHALGGLAFKVVIKQLLVLLLPQRHPPNPPLGVQPSVLPPFLCDLPVKDLRPLIPPLNLHLQPSDFPIPLPDILLRRWQGGLQAISLPRRHHDDRVELFNIP